MSAQAARDARTLARSCDPITSIKAAESAAVGLVETHENRIRAAIRKHGNGTAEEIGEWCGLTIVQVCRRLPYMCDLEPLTTETGAEITRRLNDGRFGRVWGAK